MPMKPLNQNDSFESIKKWVNENLNEEQKIIACCDQINKVPKSKGIYFWFLHPEGYKELSQYIDVNPIELKISRKINGIEYDLVYLGTAGTGKNGGGDLNERFLWHIVKPHHTEKNVCKGFLSTLRCGLSALLAEDLININTEELVNQFIREFMIVFWLEYPDNIDLIDKDEKILIKLIKPLFNIKNNPNASTNSHNNPTKIYRKRRMSIINKTRLRLNFLKKSEFPRISNVNTSEVISYAHQVLINDDDCIQFTVSSDQDISFVTRGIDIIPTVGFCTIEIFNSIDHNFVFDLWTFRKTKDIFNYFSRENTKYPLIGKRSQIIHQWMIDNQIDEITVKLQFYI